MSRKSPKPSRLAENSDQNSGPNNGTAGIYGHPDLTAVVEIVKNKFYLATLLPGTRNPESPTADTYLFETDTYLTYKNFYDDFGPLNLACLYKYCREVNKVLANPRFKLIVHYTSSNAKLRANAVYLAASYSVLYLDQSPSDVYKSMRGDVGVMLRPFQDASIGISRYTIDLLDCLNALKKSASLGFFDFEDFDVHDYEKYGKIRNGDLNWIVPRKFIAFLGPSTEPGTALHYPEKYLNYFMKNDVATVLRLNKANYEAHRFTSAGILHYEMYFPDGSTPPMNVLREFLHVAESTRGTLAVHCKAGLGRTGTLIAAYMMKHYMFSAREAVAWLRICRPGSVIGAQQVWLESIQGDMWREGRQFRLKYHGDDNLILHHKRGIYSIAEKLDKKARLDERRFERRCLLATRGSTS
ncbi:dual specificity protein phosphatase CDC14A-like [Copidosoma floridanum]|uniref:dual specificity protein phosphatase CDC14A-like n=1 Tax=Copidosoma floridanum TaxID=29053 RepID=UPI0006C96A38|nr:dual specificity protein phosphatase CDC14A-like [Copidosoma floridanum]